MTSWFVPGRIEVFGKHTDYAGGHSLLAAVDRGVTVAVASDDVFRATSDAFPDETIELIPGQPLQAGPGHWGHYLQVVLDRLTLNFGPLEPVRFEISSTLPAASGMSSSSALVCAAVLALVDHAGLLESPRWTDYIHDELELASYCSCVENGYDYPGLPGSAGVGTLAGAQDQTAMIACREGEITEFSYIPSRRYGSCALPDGWCFVVGVSGVRAEKSGAVKERYNYLSSSTKELLERWNDATGRDDVILNDVLSVEDGVAGLREIVADDEALTRRLEAFVEEVTQCIPQAFEALEACDVDAFGEAALRSHRNADERLGNQIPETNRLVELARELGAPAASAFGAGFGGSTWALARKDDAEQFAARWGERYRAEFPDTNPEFIITQPSAPAHKLS